MVMAAQTLAQLEPVVVAPSGDALQDADVLEHDQIAVERALRERAAGSGAIVDRHQLGHGQRTPSLGDEVEDLAPQPGVPLTDLGQSPLGGGVDCVALTRRVFGRHIGKGIGA